MRTDTNKSLYKVRVFIIVLFYFSLELYFTPFISAAEEINPGLLGKAISKGTAFLKQSQLPWGEFKTICSSSNIKWVNCHADGSPFITTFVVYSLDFIDNKETINMGKKALKFFLKEMEKPGIWSFWTSRNNKKIDPDLDDISCISYILKKNRVVFKSNFGLIYKNRNDQGIFYTWIRSDSSKDNEIDCVVNANVLLYLGENEYTKPAIEYLNNLVLNNKEETCSIYYPDKTFLYYALSRAYFNGIFSLKKSKEAIINKIVSIQRKNGSFGNELSTACAICTLLNFGYQDPNLNKAIRYILKTQRKDGSWQKNVFFLDPSSPTYFGSEELTTAICLEALARYRNVLISNKE